MKYSEIRSRAKLHHATLLVIGLFISIMQLHGQDTTQALVRQLEGRVTQLDSTISINKESVDQFDQRRRDLNSQISQSTATIDSLTRKVAELKRASVRADSINKTIAILNQMIDQKLLVVRALDSSNSAQQEKRAALDSTINIKKEVVDSLDKALNALKGEQSEVEKRIADARTLIAKQHDSLEVVAWMELGNPSVSVMRDPSGAGDPAVITMAKVQEVNISVREGIIQEVIIKTDQGIFRNHDAVIGLQHLGGRAGSDKLYREHQKYDPNHKPQDYIRLDEAVWYHVVRSYAQAAYGDFDIKLTPDTGNRSYLLRESTSINTYFDIAAFTDLKALGGEPNAIAQFTAEAKFITKTRNVKNSATIWWNHISFRGGVSKFDNDYKGARVYDNDSVSRRDVLQRAQFSVGVKANIIRGLGSPRPKHLFSDLQLNVGYNFLGSKVFDTTIKAAQVIDTAYRTITQNQIYIEPQVTVNRRRNFSMTLSLPLYLVSIKKSALISNDEMEFWARPSINLMYYGKHDPDSKIFFRYNHFINLKEPKNAFSQMQMGLAVALTKLWDTK